MNMEIIKNGNNDIFGECGFTAFPSVLEIK